MPTSKQLELLYDGGLESSCSYLDRAKKPLISDADRDPRRARRHHRRSRHVVERQLPRERAGLHQQHPAARRRHASRRLPRRADAPGDRLWRNLRPDQEGEGGADRRRLPRGADGGAVGQGAGPEILLADQGQAGVVRGPAGRREPGQRGARHLARRTSGRGQGGRSTRSSRRRPPARRRARRATSPARARSASPRCPASSPTARSAIRPSRNSSSSRAIRPAARPRAGARARTRRSCRCAARS